MEKVDVSILISTRNRASILRHTLQSLRNQHLNGIRWEIVVVDNGSSDDTAQVLHEAQSWLPLIPLTEPTPGKNRALNRALDVVTGELLIFTDDDTEHTEQWVSELVAASRQWPEISIFGGPVIPLLPPETPEWIRQNRRITSIAFSHFDLNHTENTRLEDPTLPFGPNYALRATAVDGKRFSLSLGPQAADPQSPLGDETEFLARIYEENQQIGYVPRAKVFHRVEKHQLESAWLLNRAFRFGRGFVHFAPNTTSFRLGGVPARLMVVFCITWLFHHLFFFRAEPQKFKTSSTLHFLRGQMVEYRRLHRSDQSNSYQA